MGSSAFSALRWTVYMEIAPDCFLCILDAQHTGRVSRRRQQCTQVRRRSVSRPTACGAARDRGRSGAGYSALSRRRPRRAGIVTLLLHTIQFTRFVCYCPRIIPVTVQLTLLACFPESHLFLTLVSHAKFRDNGRMQKISHAWGITHPIIGQNNR